MKKILMILGFITFMVLIGTAGFILGSEDVSRLRDEVRELQEIDNEPLNGIMVTRSQYYMATATFEEGRVTKITILDIDGTFDEEIIEDESEIYRSSDYAWMMMMLNELLAEKDELYGAEEPITEPTEEPITE